MIPKEIRRTMRIREGDPSQMTWTWWEMFCFGMLDLAKEPAWIVHHDETGGLYRGYSGGVIDLKKPGED